MKTSFRIESSDRMRALDGCGGSCLEARTPSVLPLAVALRRDLERGVRA